MCWQAKKWTLGVSIPLPPACEAGALPSELNAQLIITTHYRATKRKPPLQHIPPNNHPRITHTNDQTKTNTPQKTHHATSTNKTTQQHCDRPSCTPHSTHSIHSITPTNGPPLLPPSLLVLSRHWDNNKRSFYIFIFCHTSIFFSTCAFTALPASRRV